MIRKQLSLMHVARTSRCLYTVALLFTTQLQAAEWSAEPEISLKTGYNDNIRLTTADHDPVWETTISPSLRFGVAREHQGLTGNAKVSIRRFSGGSGLESSEALDREDYFLMTNAYHQTEKNIFRGSIDYINQSTQDSQLDEFGDVISNRATRERITLTPSWGRTLNERTYLNLNGQFTTISYSDEPATSNLVEYDSYSVSGSLVRQLTPRIQGTLSTSYSVYKPEENALGFSADSSTVNLQAGISKNFSETLVASFLAGQRETTSDTLIGTGFCIGADPGASFPGCSGGIAIPTGTAKDETDNTGLVFSGSIKKILETGFLSASLSRSTNPGSDGELLDTTRLILSGEHRLSETLRATLTAEYNNRETIVNEDGRESDQADQNLFRIRPRLSWRWRREWEIVGEYEYAENENVDSGKARRNALYLTLNYSPAKISLSR